MRLESEDRTMEVGDRLTGKKRVTSLCVFTLIRVRDRRSKDSILAIWTDSSDDPVDAELQNNPPDYRLPEFL